MEYAAAVVVLSALVALAVAGPLRARAGVGVALDQRRDELEAAKEAKYREIRDAELDFRIGKVSAADHRATDRELRAQAVAILERLDELEGSRRPPATLDRP